jgi:hypothetical protein
VERMPRVMPIYPPESAALCHSPGSSGVARPGEVSYGSKAERPRLDNTSANEPMRPCRHDNLAGTFLVQILNPDDLQ